MPAEFCGSAIFGQVKGAMSVLLIADESVVQAQIVKFTVITSIANFRINSIWRTGLASFPLAEMSK